MTKPLIIYHGNCADGFSAAWCFWHKYGEDAEYHVLGVVIAFVGFILMVVAGGMLT